MHHHSFQGSQSVQELSYGDVGWRNVVVASQDNRDQIFNAFQNILTDRKNLGSRIATKEEEAEKTRNAHVLKAASTYTVDGIVKGLADLQLEFGGIITNLSAKLAAEASKLEELERALEIETLHLQMLQQIRVVADTLHLLTQEHQEKLRTLEQTGATQKFMLEKEIAEQRSLWEKEQADFENVIQEQHERLTKERERQEADYQYELTRQQTVDENEFEEKQRNQKKELQEADQVNERQWAERERILEENQPLLEDYRQRVEVFSAELNELVENIKTDAADAVNQDAEVQAKLLEKEWDATKQGYEFTIQALEQKIQEQTQQIENFNAQLQETLQQSHALTMKAFEKSSRIDSQKKET